MNDIDIVGLNFSYDNEKDVIKNFNLTLKKGSSISILGPSGCGKSTLLGLIAGLISTPENCRKFEIARLDLLRSSSAFQEFLSTGKLGFLFQEPILFEHLTVEKNIELTQKIVGRSDPAVIKHLMELVKLDSYRDMYPKKLSGGMKSRLALACLFATQPEIFLLDEPFSSLDIILKNRLYSEFLRLKERTGGTYILVTHDIFEAILFSNNLVVMRADGTAVEYCVNDWSLGCEYAEVVANHARDFVLISKLLDEANTI